MRLRSLAAEAKKLKVAPPATARAGAGKTAKPDTKVAWTQGRPSRCFGRYVAQSIRRSDARAAGSRACARSLMIQTYTPYTHHTAAIMGDQLPHPGTV